MQWITPVDPGYDESRTLSDFQCFLDDPPGKYNYWSADYHDELSDDALDVIVDSARNLPRPSSQQLIAHWAGPWEARPRRRPR